jgi:hypothetical protein
VAVRVAKTKIPKPALASFIETMDCLSVIKLPEGPEWSYEIKFSGLGAGLWTSPLSQEKTSLEA